MIVLVAMVGLVVLVWGFRSERAEPEYQGRPLSRWLQDIEVYNSHPDRESAEFLAASNAVVQIGPEGLPCLVEWIQWEPSTAERTISMAAGNVLDWLPEWVIPWSFMEWVQRSSKFQRLGAAGYALGLMGADLEPYIPQLAEIARNPRSSFGSHSAISALKAAGPRAWNEIALLVAATNSEASPRALHYLDGLGTNALPAMPGLIHHLHGTNEHRAQSAAYALGTLQLEPELVVPALSGALSSPHSQLRIAAANALGRFGSQGAPALTHLNRLLGRGDPYVRAAASNSIQRITSAMQAGAPSSSPVPTNGQPIP